MPPADRDRGASGVSVAPPRNMAKTGREMVILVVPSLRQTPLQPLDGLKVGCYI
jgi:hypothetical protein